MFLPYPFLDVPLLQHTLAGQHFGGVSQLVQQLIFVANRIFLWVGLGVIVWKLWLHGAHAQQNHDQYEVHLEEDAITEKGKLLKSRPGRLHAMRPGG